MANTYYTSLSGMLAASYGLQNTSNNIANMQTPGFKRTDVFYSSLGNSNSDLLGCGVHVAGSSTNFTQANYLETENPSDLAVVGPGFFVIKLKNNEYAYTRNGEFGFNNQGILVDKHSGGEVQGYDKSGQLVPIRQKGPKHTPGKPSRELYLQGEFVRIEAKEDATDPSPNKSRYENIKFELAQVYDKEGKSHTVCLEFACTPTIAEDPSAGKSWDLVKVSWDGNDDRIQFNPPQNITFSGLNSCAEPDKNSIQFIIDGEQSVTLKFGVSTDGKAKSVELQDKDTIHTQTTIQALENDGYGTGTQLGCSFNEDGQIIYNYDNGQDIKGIHVGLARFEDLENQLTPMHDSLFKARESCPIHLGRANQDGFGSVEAKRLERSNVDSTMEFANIVVLQRMFQACSQIMNIDKQLLEELEGRS